jgi:SAM-dependent methyltransferase
MTFKDQYDNTLKNLMDNPPSGFLVRRSEMFEDTGDHPADFTDFECAFASRMLKQQQPMSILDIGSYRHFTLGLMASYYSVLSLDIRSKRPMLGENRAIGDIRDVGAIGSFDAIVSLCTIEHIGLGRYGDALDIDGDKKAVDRMKRMLNPRGVLILSVPIGPPCIVFNAHRIYSHQMIWDLCSGLNLVRETICCSGTLDELKSSEITSIPTNFEIYCGCWRMP